MLQTPQATPRAEFDSRQVLPQGEGTVNFSMEVSFTHVDGKFCAEEPQ